MSRAQASHVQLWVAFLVCAVRDVAKECNRRVKRHDLWTASSV